MNEPERNGGPLTLAEVFRAERDVSDAVQKVRKGLSWWRRRRWSFAGVDDVIQTELDRVFGRSIEEILGDVFRSATDKGVQTTFGEIAKLIKKLKKARKQLHRYQKATPEEPADFKLGIKQTITLNLNHTIRIDATAGNSVEIELDIKLVVVFEGASVGVAQRHLYYLSLGSCNIGGSALRYAVKPGRPEGLRGPIPAKVLKTTLGRIPFIPPIQIPFMDRRTGPRRIEAERRVEVVEVDIERRVATRRVAEQRGEMDRRQTDRRGGERREAVERRAAEDRRNTAG